MLPQCMCLDMPVQAFTHILCPDMLVQQTPKALEWEQGSVRNRCGLRQVKCETQIQTDIDNGTETKMSEIQTSFMYNLKKQTNRNEALTH